ncbi:MAG: hypothetical protein HFJ41_02520 [Clostridia bacterium]|nr:hypothetical protein [Clostridia bacterium]
MKSNFFKYIFIIFAICIIIYSVYAIYFKEKDNTDEKVQAEEQEVIEKKDIRLGISNFDNINPLISNNKEILNIDKLIFEPLVNITKDYKIQMCLATECSKTSETSYVIKIDNDKKWQDGSPFTAKDIQFTIDRLKEGSSIYAYNVQKISSVEIIDSSTIKINLSEEVPFFEYNLTFPILPNNYYIGENFYTSAKVPIGTGMYKISSIDSNNIKLEKNEKWWNIKNENAKIETIDIKIFSEIGEIYNSFKLGNIDIFTTSNYNLENYIGTIGYVKTEFKAREFDYLAFNCEDSILKNIQVRKAIEYSIDKTNITSTVFNNNRYISDFPLDYGNYLYTSNNLSSGYNTEQAKKVLQEDGWQYKNNKWQKTENYRTSRINLNLTVNKDDANRLAVAENIKSQLAQIGINITIKKVSTSQYNNILQNKNYQMILTGVYNSYSPNVETFFGPNNLQNYKNEELNAILTDVKNIKDENLLKEKYDKILEIYNNELPFLSLYRSKSTVIRSQKLAGELTPNNYFSYYNFYTWSRM